MLIDQAAHAIDVSTRAKGGRQKKEDGKDDLNFDRQRQEKKCFGN